uniref:Alcohol dehydrogenase-like N-terminal domain-containing protein n=1 Tax=Rousettus aegyptiacus TaxID=9407 RepID=A0A7J8BFK3_ROUAE|nr:hypothetical protein HJG63_009731 [Rousettus aegyptiacus]
MAVVVWRRCFPWVRLCRRALLGSIRHYRAALCTELKQPLAIEEVAPRPVRPHEVRVDVHFCGVNFADILVCRGQYQEKQHLPFTPGMEFSGTVLETGTEVSTVKKGDRVIGVNKFNCMAEEQIVDQKRNRFGDGSSRSHRPCSDRRGNEGSSGQGDSCSWKRREVRAGRAEGRTGQRELQPGQPEGGREGAGGQRRRERGRGHRGRGHLPGGPPQPGVGGQDCGGGFCWRNHCFCAGQSPAPEEYLCHGAVLRPIQKPELSRLLQEHVLCPSVLPARTHSAVHRSSF